MTIYIYIYIYNKRTKSEGFRVVIFVKNQDDGQTTGPCKFIIGVVNLITQVTLQSSIF
jgi:hypothetical protein